MLANWKLPLIKAFAGQNGSVFYMPCISTTESPFLKEKLVGQKLIDFVELDFKEFNDKVIMLNLGRKVRTEIFEKYTFQQFEKGMIEAVEELREKHYYAYILTAGDLLRALSQSANLASLSQLKEQEAEILNTAYDVLLKIWDLTHMYKQALRYCLDSEAFTSHTLPERMMMFYDWNPEYSNVVFKSGVSITHTKNGFFDESDIEETKKQPLSSEKEQLAAIHKDHKKGVSTMSYMILDTLEEFLYFEFCEMMKHGVMAKKCKLCGKYFVLKDNRRREYCHRIYKDGKTCSEVGAKITFDREVKEDLILIEYEAIYNTVYSRMYRAEGKLSDELSGKDMTEDEFKAWSEMAKTERKKYKNREISGQELLSRIRRD